jgi:glycosyltransferase involved in cell wall biosynthesis
MEENKQGVSVIIPVYNEQNSIESTIDRISKEFSGSNTNYEIVVVNDGSKDNTRKILEDSKHDFTLLHHSINKGYGAALKTGIKSSKYPLNAIIDADGTYPAEYLPLIYHEINKNGCRMVVGKRPFKKLPLLTKPAKWFITSLANYLVEFNIPDINSGLRIFYKEDALRFFNIIPNGFSFTTTITLALLSNNMEVKYIPIDYLKREGKSKIRPIYDTINFIQLIIRTVLYYNPLKVFVPLFFILIFAGVAVFSYSYFFLPRILDITIALIVFTAIQLLSIGMLADLIDKRMN